MIGRLLTAALAFFVALHFQQTAMDVFAQTPLQPNNQESVESTEKATETKLPNQGAVKATYLVLKNGNFVEGTILKNGSDYEVQTAQGSRLVIPADRADFLCSSLEEVYWGKLARTRSSNVAGQIQLLQWCLQNDLLQQAQNQIDILQGSEIKAERLEYLDRQLAIAFEQHAARKKQAIEDAVFSEYQLVGNKNQSQRLEDHPANVAVNPVSTSLAKGAAEVGSLPRKPMQLAVSPLNPPLVPNYDAKPGSQSIIEMDSKALSGLEVVLDPIPNIGLGNPEELDSNVNNTSLEYFANVDTVFRPLPSLAEGLNLNPITVPMQRMQNTGQLASIESPVGSQAKPEVAEAISSSSLPRLPRTQPVNPEIENGLATAETIYKSIRSPMDEEKSEVIQVGFNQPETSDINMPAISAAPNHELVSVAELDRLTRSMPRGSLVLFRQKVENEFIRNCTICHEEGSEFMPLMHAGRLQLISRRMSQRNLNSILKYVDKDDPLRSPLLTAAATPHGKAEKAGIAKDSVQFANLQKWVVMVSNQPDALNKVKPIKPDTIGLMPMASEIPKASQPAIDNGGRVNGGVKIKALTPEDIEANPLLRGLDSMDSPRQPVEANPDPSFKPRDEFDPEIFNRQFGSGSGE